jgi:iron complex transport system ATP-binding protein
MSGPDDAILRTDKLTVRLGKLAVVDEVTFALRRGELTALVGPNGAGKTTLVRALAGLLPFDGKIVLDGRALGAYSTRERAQRIAYLPQGNVFHWPIAVESVVALGRYPYADPYSTFSAADRAAVARALAATAIEAHAQRPVTTLSGGERARVALARALATEAPVLLADEPTVALDARHQLLVMEELRAAARAGNAVLVIVHDLTLAARFADRVLVMDYGGIVADAAPDEALDARRMGEVFGVDAAMVEFGDGRIPIARRPL